MDLLLNFIMTAAINLTPALIIRYLIKKRPLNKKSYAVITCIIIAICAWSIIYFSSGVIPKGFTEEFYGIINFFILKPRNETTQDINEQSTVKEHNEHSETEVLPVESGSSSNELHAVSTANNMDTTMEEYYDAMLSPQIEESILDIDIKKAMKVAKVSIMLNLILIIILCVSAKIYVNSKVQLTEAEENYNKVLESKKTMKNAYEEEIFELNEQLDWYIDQYGINWDYFLENAREADKKNK